MVLTAHLLVNVLAQGGLYFVYALALALVLFPLRVFHAGLGAIVSVAGYALVLLVNKAHWSLPMAALAAVAVCAGLGMTMEWLVYRPLFLRRASSLSTAISSLAIYMVVTNGITALFSSQQGFLTPEAASLPLWGVRLSLPQMLMACAPVAVFLLMLMGLRSKYGRAIRGIEESPTLLQACGWNIMAIRTGCILVSSALAGLGGCLAAFDTGIEPGMGMSGVLNALVVVVVAGPGSYKGLFPISITMALLQQTFGYCVSPRWESAVSFTILTGFLLLHPNGLFASKRRVEELV